MHQSGEVCVFFIKMLHSINLSSREDTGGPGAQLTRLSFLAWGRSVRLSSRPIPASAQPPAASVPGCNGCICFIVVNVVAVGFTPSFWPFPSLSHPKITIHLESSLLPS